MNKPFLNFTPTNCKNCYKCLRECPVKAITIKGDKAQIVPELCILCGRCANVCPTHAKQVVDDKPLAYELISRGGAVASVAPAFVASFATTWEKFRSALIELGFSDAEETAVGASAVIKEYQKILAEKSKLNLIASPCPSIVSMIQLYYPSALKYLAMVDSPMVAHAKLLKSSGGDKVKNVIFIGPCISKKREAHLTGVVDCVLTFEEISAMMLERGIDFNAEAKHKLTETQLGNRAKYFPINRGVIKSFEHLSPDYEFVSIDGVARSKEVLGNIDSLSGMFIEMHACEFSCINGPCALVREHGGFIKATEEVRKYVKNDVLAPQIETPSVNLNHNYEHIKSAVLAPTEREIQEILAKTGKTSPELELNCGACGYATCREKAIAVYNGMAEVTMCVPFMREKAESMSYEIIHSSPNGIFSIDSEFRLLDINQKAKELLGITDSALKGELLEKYYNPTDFVLALTENKTIQRKEVYLEKTDSYVELYINKVNSAGTLFCIMKDITDEVKSRTKLDKMKEDTIDVTNNVIAKQMRVVQEIASLLGETAAETKVALIKLKNAIIE